jgi:hypothetical protein
LKWFAVGGDTPRAIVVLRKGTRKSIKTISKRDPVAWESWQPVLAELKAKKQRTNKKRVSHKELKTGKL